MNMPSNQITKLETLNIKYFVHELLDALLPVHKMLTSYANKSGLLNSSKSPSKELKRSI